jgi:hypothetical protein
VLGGPVAAAALESPRRLIQELLLPGVNLVRMNLVPLRQVGHRHLLPQRFQRDVYPGHGLPMAGDPERPAATLDADGTLERIHHALYIECRERRARGSRTAAIIAARA